MIQIKDYKDRIEELYKNGHSAYSIYKILGLKYYQPVLNYFKKMGWERTPRKDYVPKTKYRVNKEFFQKIDSEEKSYILGFICADGHVDYNRIKIELKDSDYTILDKIRQAMGSNHPIVRKIVGRNPYTKSENKELLKCSISINSVDLVKPLQKMGLVGNKTYTLDGTILSYIPTELIKHFLRGYFDGDGNIFWGKKYSSGKKYSVSVAGNLDFLQNTFNKVFPSNTSIYRDKKSRQNYQWKITSKYEVAKFTSYLYSDASIYLDRKYKLFKYIMWSFKTELIAGNSYFIELIKGQSAANLLVKSLQQVQRLADETIVNPFGEEI